MEKEFVPYEEALELKELGFDEICMGYRDGGGQLMIKQTPHCVISSPTYSQAFRWFRDEHKLFGQVNVCTYFIYDMSNNDGFHTTLKMIKEYDKLCNNYEESELECLKKLIAIVKNK